MKTKLKLIALCCLLSAFCLSSHAQGTAFTYQGQLQNNGSPANGSYDLTFAVFTDSNGVNQVGSTLTNTATGITNGLFTVVLDFGQGIFTGTPLWLQIGAETNGASSFTTLTPLQQLTPAPYAIYAPSAGSAATANGVAAGAVTGAGIAGNSVVKSLNNLQDAVTLSPGANVTITPSGNTLTIASAGGGGGGGWSLTGNSGTTPGANYLGTSDNQPLEVHVNGLRALRLEPDISGRRAPNVIGGSPFNFVASGVQGATIGGGGGFAGPPYTNIVTGEFGTVGGGVANTANTYATVSGGLNNMASGENATVGGGINNTASGAGAFVGGGGIDGTLTSANIASGGAATVAGGILNEANGKWATVPGGYENIAQGKASFAAGQLATANDNNSFIWGDGTRAATSQGTNTFTVLATGGAYFYTTASGVDVVIDNSGDLDFGTTTRQMINLYSTSYGIGVQANDEYFRTAGQFYWYLNGSHNNANGNSGGGSTLMSLSASGLYVNTTFVSASDRNLKENFQPINPEQVLERVSALPISKWNYKLDAGTEHLGPMAQDFYAAFNIGPDDKHIAVIDEGGVALAAIQGLNQKLNEKDAEIQDLKQSVADLKKLVQSLAEKK
jgi:hypothetical protein